MAVVRRFRFFKIQNVNGRYRSVSVRQGTNFHGYWLIRYREMAIFGRPFVKRFALCYRTDVLSVVDVLWSNGYKDGSGCHLAWR